MVYLQQKVKLHSILVEGVRWNSLYAMEVPNEQPSGDDRRRRNKSLIYIHWYRGDWLIILEYCRGKKRFVLSSSLINKLICGCNRTVFKIGFCIKCREMAPAADREDPVLIREHDSLFGNGKAPCSECFWKKGKKVAHPYRWVEQHSRDKHKLPHFKYQCGVCKNKFRTEPEMSAHSATFGH